MKGFLLKEPQGSFYVLLHLRRCQLGWFVGVKPLLRRCLDLREGLKVNHLSSTRDLLSTFSDMMFYFEVKVVFNFYSSWVVLGVCRLFVCVWVLVLTANPSHSPTDPWFVEKPRAWGCCCDRLEADLEKGASNASLALL